MDLVKQMRGFESDHEPDGWPAIQMTHVSALCDEIERLQSIIDEANAQNPFTVIDYDGERAEIVMHFEVRDIGKIKLYRRPIPVQQSPAVAVPDELACPSWADVQNIELVIARLEQIIDDRGFAEELAAEALPCARALLAKLNEVNK